MEDVIKDMLNEASKDMRYKKIFIDDIDPSDYNQYPMEEIEELAYNIKESGLLHPITLFKKKDGRYMILSGERRYRAMRYNYENGDDRWEEIPSIIKEAELDERLLKRYIRRGNANRESLAVDLKIKIVEEALVDFELSKSAGEVPTGMLKRKWISMDTGFSERSVQDYLNQIEKSHQTEKKEQKQSDEKMNKFGSLQESFTKVLRVPVKITDKKITLSIKNEEDIQRIMEILNIDS